MIRLGLSLIMWAAELFLEGYRMSFAVLVVEDHILDGDTGHWLRFGGIWRVRLIELRVERGPKTAK